MNNLEDVIHRHIESNLGPFKNIQNVPFGSLFAIAGIMFRHKYPGTSSELSTRASGIVTRLRKVIPGDMSDEEALMGLMVIAGDLLDSLRVTEELN